LTIPEVSVIDFFSGCGGTSQGFRDAGFRILAGVDNDPDSASTYRANFPGAHFIEKDVQSLTTADVRALMPSEGLVLFAGCAPCQPFSRQNREQRSDDPKRLLLLEFLRFVLDLKPHFVVVENVPGLQNVDADAGPFKQFVDALRAAHYEVDFDVVKASSYGVPQTRRRLVLIASRVGKVRLPPPTHGSSLLPVSTVADWIRGLPELEAGEVDPIDNAHASMMLSDLNLERIRATTEGAGRESWPERLHLAAHKGHAGHSDVYGRLAWNKPASGLTTRCISYSNGRFGHPEQDRALSAREAALLQTFPKSFQISGSLASKAKQIGNAVPPLLATRIAESILAAIEPSPS
jgi:DNA (cytosine-5)-methyltransferase 1